MVDFLYVEPVDKNSSFNRSLSSLGIHFLMMMNNNSIKKNSLCRPSSSMTQLPYIYIAKTLERLPTLLRNSIIIRRDENSATPLQQDGAGHQSSTSTSGHSQCFRCFISFQYNIKQRHTIFSKEIIPFFLSWPLENMQCLSNVDVGKLVPVDG